MMSVIFAAILYLLPGPSPKWNETREAFRERTTMISKTIDVGVRKVAPPQLWRPLALAVAVVYWGEGRFSPLVQSGERRGDGGLAICLGGHHQLKLSTEEWEGLAGLDYDSTLRCSELTAKRLLSSWNYCQNLNPSYGWTEAMTLYGTGRTCRPEESKWENIFRDRGRKHATLLAQK